MSQYITPPQSPTDMRQADNMKAVSGKLSTSLIMLYLPFVCVPSCLYICLLIRLYVLLPPFPSPVVPPPVLLCVLHMSVCLP